MEVQEMVQKVKKALLAMQRYSWEQGVTAQAMLESGETELAILMAKEAVNRQTEDGRLAIMGNNTGVTDPAAVGEALLYAAKATGDEALKAAADRMLDYLLNKAPKTKDGTLYHIDNKNQVWVDSYYMAPPFLAAAGHYHEAVKQIEGFRKLLWNDEKKLFSHIWDDDKQAFDREAFWGVGNGWAAAGMTRVLRSLPEEMVEEKKRLTRYIKEVIDGCMAYMREDGLYHDVVDDPSSFVETNLAQMISYSIYWGVYGGWLDSSYLPAADKMREAAEKKVDQYGLVQGVCGAPSFDHSGTAPEGQAFFLLMEAAAQKIRR